VVGGRVVMRLVRMVCRVCGLLSPGRGRYSWPLEGNVGTMGLSERLWWTYKYYGRSIEQAERGKGIEEHFAGQDLRFTLPDGFVQQSTVVITSGGDLLTSEHIRPDNSVQLWDDIADYFFRSDLVVANLETPIAKSGPDSSPPTNIKAPVLNGTPEMLRAYTVGGKGINFFSTANNHCLDQGIGGLIETLDLLDSVGCGHVGTSRSAQDRDDIPVLSINGIRIALLSYTFSVNGREIPSGQEHVVNYVRLNVPDCDVSLIERHVRRARDDKGADVVIACLHWSLEFESYPVRHLIDTGHRLMELGIDVILGNHPHVLQPMERYRFTDPNTGVDKDGLIVYAHGDLVSYLSMVPNSMVGNVVRLTFAKGVEAGQSVSRIAHMDFTPVYHGATFVDGLCVDFRLLDFAKLLRTAPASPATWDAPELRRLSALVDKLLPMKLAVSTPR
jgi:poly-gamma-glutamate capsule biosynthesis protein CapA/YwtB (metallophosphatase superfamily)